MTLATRLFSREREHFDLLGDNGKRLILASFLYNTISPIFGLFASAFVLRQSQDIALVALYNLFMYAGLPLGFYINGWLLRKFSPNRLYLVGATMQALTISLLIFLSLISYPAIICFGLAFGISAGLFWANRNFLLFKVTRRDNRIYYSGLDSTGQTIANILIPIIIGTFLIWGTKHALYTPIQGYYMISLLTFVVIGILGFVVKSIIVEKPIINHIFIRKPVEHWNKIRGTNFTVGLFQGSVNFFPTLLVFTFIGNEDALGTVQSLSAILSAIIVYSVGKRVVPEQRIWMVSGAIAVLIIGAALMSIFFSLPGIFTYLAVQSMSAPLLLIAIGSLILDRMDQDHSGSGYPYIFDNELFLNLGRIVGVGAFLLLIFFFASNTALRVTPVLLAISQIVLFMLVKSLEGKSIRRTTKRYLAHLSTIWHHN